MKNMLFKKPFSLLLSTIVICTLTGLSRSPLRAAQQGNANTNGGQSQSVTLAGLKDRVTIRRDERGIPYIEATNEADLYFAQGYVTASDRLWQMDLYRRTVRGELSELFGTTTLAEDQRRRTFGF